MKHKIERAACLQEVVTRSVVRDPVLPSVKEALSGCPHLFLKGQVQVTVTQPVQVTAQRTETKDADQPYALLTSLRVFIWAVSPANLLSTLGDGHTHDDGDMKHSLPLMESYQCASDYTLSVSFHLPQMQHH